MSFKKPNTTKFAADLSSRSSVHHPRASRAHPRTPRAHPRTSRAHSPASIVHSRASRAHSRTSGGHSRSSLPHTLTSGDHSRSSHPYSRRWSAHESRGRPRGSMHDLRAIYSWLSYHRQRHHRRRQHVRRWNRSGGWDGNTRMRMGRSGWWQPSGFEGGRCGVDQTLSLKVNRCLPGIH